MSQFVFYALIGRVCVFFLQKFPFAKIPFLREWGFLRDLLACDLCLGVWVYTFFAAVFRLNLLDVYIPGLCELLTGASLSLIVWLVRIGYQTQFGTIEIK